MKRLRLTLFVACALSSAAADFSSYAGDPSTYLVTGIAVDARGNTYVTGTRQLASTTAGVRLSDVFVSRFDPSGHSQLLASFGGKGTDEANGIALDPAGNIYVVGNTTSTNFPMHRPLQEAASGDGYPGTGFLVKMTADGTVLYSTYLGGTLGPSSMNAVAADSEGNAYVTGGTFAPDYPHTAGLPAGHAEFRPGADTTSMSFFAKVSPAGDRILYAGGSRRRSTPVGRGAVASSATSSTAGTGSPSTR